MTLKELQEAYGEEKINDIIKDLKSKNVTVHHGIDATSLESSELIFDGIKKLDHIIFNFPCIPGSSTAQDA